jgi:PII-like signaling protein
LIVEIVDKEEKLNDFLKVLEKMLDHGLITLEMAEVIVYR